MSSISQAPLSSPITDGRGRLSESWHQYFLATGIHTERSTTPKRAQALDKPGEFVTYLHETAKISYTYTGKGGCTFNLDGNKLVLPATDAEQTINSFMIIAQGA